jgi:hypothetical protein
VEKPTVLVAEGLNGSVPRETASRRAIGDAAVGEAAAGDAAGGDATRSAMTVQTRIRKRQRKQ